MPSLFPMLASQSSSPVLCRSRLARPRVSLSFRLDKEARTRSPLARQLKVFLLSPSPILRRILSTRHCRFLCRRRLPRKSRSSLAGLVALHITLHTLHSTVSCLLRRGVPSIPRKSLCRQAHRRSHTPTLNPCLDRHRVLQHRLRTMHRRRVYSRSSLTTIRLPQSFTRPRRNIRDLTTRHRRLYTRPRRLTMPRPARPPL